MGTGGTIATIVVGGITLVYIGKKAKDYFEKEKQKGQLKIDQNTTIVPPAGKKIMYNIAGAPIKSANLATIAADIEDALSRPVDQPRAIRAFMSTPFGSVKDLETFYLNKYSDNLQARMISRLSDANWIKVKFFFR